MTPDEEVKYQLITAWPGYRVGDDGSVWSRRNTRGNDIGHWRRKSQTHDSAGYPVVSLSKNGKPERVRVHILVLNAFRGPCPEGYEARHYPNRDPADCRLCNLSWADASTNQRDRAEHGTSNAGERNAQCKFSDETCLEILRRRKQGDTIGELSREFTMSTSQIRDICDGKARSYLQAKVV